MATETEEEKQKKAEEHKKLLEQAREKAQELARKRAKKIIGNLIMVCILMTVVGMVLSSIGMVQVFIFFSIGMLPGIVANITDGRPGRFASKTVIAFNLAGMAQYMAAIFTSGSPNHTAHEILYNPASWLLIYGFAAFGWCVIFLIPYIVQIYLEITSSYTIKKFQHFQELLINEWGDGVKSNT